MKVYNVNVYDLDQFGLKYGRMGEMKPMGKIMVTKGLLGVREIITHQPIKVFNKESVLSRIDMSYYKKYDFVLGANEVSFGYKNQVFRSNLDEYKETFLNSEFLAFLRKYDSDALTQEIVNARVESVKRKM